MELAQPSKKGLESPIWPVRYRVRATVKASYPSFNSTPMWVLSVSLYPSMIQSTVLSQQEASHIYAKIWGKLSPSAEPSLQRPSMLLTLPE